MAVDMADGDLSTNMGISSAEGVEIFRRILSGNTEPQIIVSEVNLWNFLSSSKAFASWRESDNTDHGPEKSTFENPSAYSRPHINTEYVSPRTETEKALAKVWETLLGVEPIGIHDNFFFPWRTLPSCNSTTQPACYDLWRFRADHKIHFR